MRNRLLSFVWVMMLLLTGFAAFAQDSGDSFKASNGMTFMKGDTLVLGVGSSPDGYFQYIYSNLAKTIFGALAEDEGIEVRLSPDYAGQSVVIKKIKLNGENTFLTFATENDGGFVVEIEKAIQSCELAFCQPNNYLSQEQFEKLILLYQSYNDQKISEENFYRLRSEMIGH